MVFSRFTALKSLLIQTAAASAQSARTQDPVAGPSPGPRPPKAGRQRLETSAGRLQTDLGC